jgi:penicillin-binding protein 2
MKKIILITSSLFLIGCSTRSADFSINKTLNTNIIKDINYNTLAYTDKYSKRHYRYGKYTAHTVGYITKNGLGIGLEKKYEDYLKDGNTLTTTLDINLLTSLSDLFNSYSGSFVVMNANTGAIAAANSFPNYNANIFIKGMNRKKYKALINDSRKPFVNKVINNLYQPSSLIAPAVALAFLKNGINPDTKEYCHHNLTLGTHLFSTSFKDTTRKVDLQTALENNCNYYFYMNSLMIGNEKIIKTLRHFGFENKTGVDLPKEFMGLTGDKEWKKKKYNSPWYIGDTIMNAVGKRYILVTPMQTTRYMASLVTGNLVNPHFRKDIKINRTPLNYSDETLGYIREAMYNSFNQKHGWNKDLAPQEIKISGIVNNSKQYISFYIPNVKQHYIVTLFLKDQKVTSKMLTDIITILKKYDYTR